MTKRDVLKYVHDALSHTLKLDGDHRLSSFKNMVFIHFYIWKMTKIDVLKEVHDAVFHTLKLDGDQRLSSFKILSSFTFTYRKEQLN